MQQANSLHFDDMSNSVRSSGHSSGEDHPHGVPDLINARKKIACRFGVRAKLYAIQEEASENNSSSMMVVQQQYRSGSGSIHGSSDKRSPRNKVYAVLNNLQHEECKSDILSESSQRFDGSVLSQPNIEVIKESSKNLVFNIIKENDEE